MSQTSSLTAVNVQPTDARTGHAVLGIVLAQAALRPDLADSIESFVYDRDGGLSVLVSNAGQRQHLANALGFPKETQPMILPSGGVSATARRGEMLDVTVTIWNVFAG